MFVQTDVTLKTNDGKLVGQVAGLVVGCLVGRFGGWFLGCLVSRLVGLMGDR